MMMMSTPRHQVTEDYITRLTNQARVEQGSANMFLPDNGPVHQDQVDEARAFINKWIGEKGRSINTISRGMGKGFARSTISQLLDGSYKGEVIDKLRQILRFIDAYEMSGTALAPSGLIETRITKEIVATAKRCYQSQSIGAVVGPAGFSKSTALRAIPRMLPTAVYVRIDNGEGTGPRFINSLARHLGASEGTRGARAKDFVRGRLNDARRLLLIDEAHRLTRDALEHVRDINEGGTAVILCGTIALNDLINDRSDGAQFFSRCSLVYNITMILQEFFDSGGSGKVKPPHSIEDVIRICEADQLRFTDDGAQFLYQLANVPDLGGLRIAQRLVSDVASVLGESSAKPIDRNLLWRVFQQTRGRETAAAFSVMAERLFPQPKEQRQRRARTA